MKRTAIIAGLALALVACAQDPGGGIDRRRAELASMPTVKGWNPLPGDCESACTMMLSLPKPCVHPLAEIWVHAAWIDIGDGRKAISPSGTRIMLDSFEAFPDFQKRVLRDGALTRIDPMTRYRGRTLHADGVPYCPFDVRAKSNIEQ